MAGSFSAWSIRIDTEVLRRGKDLVNMIEGRVLLIFTRQMSSSTKEIVFCTGLQFASSKELQQVWNPFSLTGLTKSMYKRHFVRKTHDGGSLIETLTM